MLPRLRNTWPIVGQLVFASVGIVYGWELARLLGEVLHFVDFLTAKLPYSHQLEQLKSLMNIEDGSLPTQAAPPPSEAQRLQESVPLVCVLLPRVLKEPAAMNIFTNDATLETSQKKEDDEAAHVMLTWGRWCNAVVRVTLTGDPTGDRLILAVEETTVANEDEKEDEGEVKDERKEEEEEEEEKEEAKAGGDEGKGMEEKGRASEKNEEIENGEEEENLWKVVEEVLGKNVSDDVVSRKKVFLKSSRRRDEAVVPHRQEDVWVLLQKALAMVWNQWKNSTMQGFIFADTRTYVIPENARLTAYQTRMMGEPWWLGAPLKDPGAHLSYRLSFGTGFMINREGLRLMGEEAEDRRVEKPKEEEKGNSRRVIPAAQYLETRLADYANRLGVQLLDSRDAEGGHRFLPHHPSNLLQDHSRNYYGIDFEEESVHAFNGSAMSLSSTAVTFGALSDVRSLYALEYEVREMVPWTSPGTTVIRVL